MNEKIIELWAEFEHWAEANASEYGECHLELFRDGCGQLVSGGGQVLGDWMYVEEGIKLLRSM